MNPIVFNKKEIIMSKIKLCGGIILCVMAIVWGSTKSITASAGTAETCCEQKKATCLVFGFDPIENEYALGKPGPCPELKTDPGDGGIDNPE